MSDKIIKCRVKSDSTFPDLIGYELHVIRDKAFYKIDDIVPLDGNFDEKTESLFQKYVNFYIGREQLDFPKVIDSEGLCAYSPSGKVDTSNPPKETGTGAVREFESGAKRDSEGKEDIRIYETGAKRDSDKNKPYVHNLQGYVRLRFGYLTRKGAEKYGDGNFLKGFPTDSAIQSLDRHWAKYLAGDRSEDHLSAMIFGIQLIMLNEEKDGIKPDHWFDNE